MNQIDKTEEPTQSKDYFITDILDSVAVKDDRHTMEHPFFSLSTKPDKDIVRYERNGVKITLLPHPELGLPTIFDKDILLYCGSLIIAELNKNKGKMPPKTICFSAHDLLIATKRHTNDVGYKMLKNAFARLTGAMIETNIETNKRKQFGMFHILDSCIGIEKLHDKRRMVKLQVSVSDWFYNALLGKEVLTINPDYFNLRKPLERRLYELARKHCGKQPGWSVKLSTLHEKCGAKSPLKNFRFTLRGIIKDDLERNHFPDYAMNLDKLDIVTFMPKKPYEILPPEIAKAVEIDIEELNGRITTKTFLRAMDLLKDTGWSFEDMYDQFVAFVKKQGKMPDYPCGALIGFIEKRLAKKSR
jgi:hypothetical protein